MRHYPLTRPTYLDAFSYVNNTTLDAGVGGDTLQTIDHAGVKTPVSHLADPTTQTQMAAVSAAGALKVDNSAVTQPVSAASLPLPTGASTSALQTTGNTSVASIDTKTPALGQALAAASVPVVLTAAQVTTLTPPAAITGYATETTLGTRLSESDFDTKTGSLTEAAPGTDTASSGLNGRLQRIAQRITTLIGSTLATSNAAASQADGHSATIGATTDASSANTLVGLLKAIKAFFTAGTGSRLDVNAYNAAGDVASGSADSGNPVKVGGKGSTNEPTAVTNGQRGNFFMTLVGKLVMLIGAAPSDTWSYAAAAGGLVSTTGVTAKTAAGAGVRNYVKSCQVINSHATIGTEVVIRDGAAGTVLHRGWAQPAGGGYALTFDPPLRGTANTLVEIGEITATATAGVLVSLQGYVSAD